VTSYQCHTCGLKREAWEAIKDSIEEWREAIKDNIDEWREAIKTASMSGGRQ
jgi:hypothetical protein